MVEGIDWMRNLRNSRLRWNGGLAKAYLDPEVLMSGRLARLSAVP